MNRINLIEDISKTGLPVYRYKNIYLHSKYDPLKEAQRFVEKKYEAASLQILIGYGNGYIYEELKNKIKKDEKIIVIDSFISPNIADSSLNEFTHQAIQDFLNQHIKVTDSINLLISINYEKIIEDSPELQLFVKSLNDRIRSNQITENTITYFISQWNENYLKNLKHAYNDHSIQELFSEKDIPVVVASGGPSLTKQLDLVKRYRDSIILIASGTTINSLLSEGIKPDLVVSVDGGEVNYQHFKDLKVTDFPLIYSPTVHYGIRENFKHAYYCFLTMEEQLIPHYEKYANDSVATLIGGSSVANVAYNLALFLTNGPVALIGQDLAYTDGFTHAKGNLNRVKKKNSENLLREGYYGDLVETDSVFLQMKEAFEFIQSKLLAHNRSYNCTEGGLNIESFQNIPFYEFLKIYAQKPVEIQYGYPTVEKNFTYYRQQLLQDIQQYEGVIILFEKALKVLKSNVSQVSYEKQVLKKLEKIDSKIKKEIQGTNLSYAFSMINLHVLRYFRSSKNASREEEFALSFKQSEYMYEEMLKVTRQTVDILNTLKEEV